MMAHPTPQDGEPTPQNRLEDLINQVLAPIPRESAGLEWRPEKVRPYPVPR